MVPDLASQLNFPVFVGKYLYFDIILFTIS